MQATLRDRCQVGSRGFDVAITTKGEETVDLVNTFVPQLIFLDVELNDKKGFDLLKQIPDISFEVIFTTAYSEHAVQSFELNAVDYLLKPFSLSRFLKACSKAQVQQELYQRNNNNFSETVFIKQGYGREQVALNDILYAESNGNYVQFVLTDKKITSRLTMAETELLLPADRFIRIHRSYIVSRKHISKLERNTLWIQQTALPVGDSYANGLAKITGSM